MSISFSDQFNMASYFLDDRIEEGRGDNIAVYFEDRRFTYSEVQGAANQAGNALRELGVEMEDRVLIVLPDSIEFVATWFGIAKIGAVIAMVNTILPTADYEYYLEYTRAKVAIVHSSVIERFAPAASRSAHLRHTVVVGWDGSGSLMGLRGNSSLVSYDRLTGQASARLETAPTSRDDIAHARRCVPVS